MSAQSTEQQLPEQPRQELTEEQIRELRKAGKNPRDVELERIAEHREQERSSLQYDPIKHFEARNEDLKPFPGISERVASALAQRSVEAQRMGRVLDMDSTLNELADEERKRLGLQSFDEQQRNKVIAEFRQMRGLKS